MNDDIIELSKICGNIGNVEEWRKKVVEILNKQRMLGLKAGLEVAKDICKREGYEFSFPDPEKIRIEREDVSLGNGEVKE